MSGSATFCIVGDRLTRAEIARENRAETVEELNAIRDLLAKAYHRAEASDVSGMEAVEVAIDAILEAMDAIIERMDLYGGEE
jgi:hypothetical protein